jgi:hypothetical protein
MGIGVFRASLGRVKSVEAMAGARPRVSNAYFHATTTTGSPIAPLADVNHDSALVSSGQVGGFTDTGLVRILGLLGTPRHGFAIAGHLILQPPYFTHASTAKT